MIFSSKNLQNEPLVLVSKAFIAATSVGLLLIIAVANNAVAQSAAHDAGTATQILVPAPSLGNNQLSDLPTQPVVIYLPPNYRSRVSSRYPVLYLLHGFSLHSSLPDWTEVISQSMNEFAKKNPEKSFIVVIPNGANKVDGSFYIDSEVGGNWEQYITRDVVGYVDAHYRTIPDRLSRAVAGHSMGGVRCVADDHAALRYFFRWICNEPVLPGL